MVIYIEYGIIDIGGYMVIGIDIDDTITNSSELIIEYAKKHFKSDDIDIINNILNVSKIDGELLQFYSKYLSEMIERYTVKDNAAKVIKRLREKGYKVVIITARGHTVTQDNLELMTTNYFNKHGIEVDEIIFRTKNKKEICIEKNIKIMVDDSINVLESLNDTNITPVLFNSIFNKDINTDIKRVDNWLELEKYISILEVN